MFMLLSVFEGIPRTLVVIIIVYNLYLPYLLFLLATHRLPGCHGDFGIIIVFYSNIVFNIVFMTIIIMITIVIILNNVIINVIINVTFVIVIDIIIIIIIFIIVVYIIILIVVIVILVLSYRMWGHREHTRKKITIKSNQSWHDIIKRKTYRMWVSQVSRVVPAPIATLLWDDAFITNLLTPLMGVDPTCFLIQASPTV